MKNIRTVGIIGAGTMGSAIAQKFAQEGFSVILADREIKFAEKGLSGIKTMLDEGIKKKVFTREQVNGFYSNIKVSSELSDLKVCDIIIEAIFEDFQAKSELFKKLSEIVPQETILATNTSSFSVTELSAFVKKPERFIGLHYFYHAAKNRLVEIIPGENTSEEIKKIVYRFCILSGKDPIYTADAYGFAINRFFVPWLNEAVKLLSEGLGTAQLIDSICIKTFGIGMGPFALMNATGIPIALHAQKTLEFFGPSYKVSDLLVKQVDKKENWKIGYVNPISINAESEKKITDRMLGCALFVCSQILEEEVCSAVDLNKGAKIGLKWRNGPIDLMKKLGEKEVKELVKNYSSLYNEQTPVILPEKWKMDYVTLEKVDSRAIITMNRPEELNALNEEVIRALNEKFTQAEEDNSIKTIFITGSGNAFVAGADIKFFIKNIKCDSLNKILEFTKYGQQVFEKIDKSKKKVVAILNGITLGGGLELALCADMILAFPKAIMSFPETGIGIYPGLGGTQRSAARIGKGLAKYLILTGKMLTSQEAKETGLIDGLISIQEMFELLDGKKNIPHVQKKVLTGKWKAYADLYSKNNFKAIMMGKYSNGFIEKEEVSELGRIMSYKAPVAMQLADELIEQAKGPKSELEKLTTIFSTSDALKGLTNIGKKVEYEGK